MLIGPLFALVTSRAAAQERPVTGRAPFPLNLRGDITFAANSIVSCEPGSVSSGTTMIPCETGRSATGSSAPNNNRYPMTPINVDPTATGVFNASSADVVLSGGAAVRWAGLYWSCAIFSSSPPPSAALRNTVRLRAPRGTYQPVVALPADFNVGTTSSGTPEWFQGFADVTSIVRGAGAGTYTVANVQCPARAVNSWGGWTLVVAYEDPALPVRNLAVFDGARAYDNATGPISLPLSGFITPASGAVNSRVGIVHYDGDRGTADSLTLVSGARRTPLGEAGSSSLNPTNDIGNGTITRFAATVTTRTPAFANNMGYDADLFATTDALPNSASSATIEAAAPSEQLWIGVVTFATDIYAPDLAATKSVVDLNGGAVEPGDEVEYTINVRNTGLDPAVGVVLSDPIPTSTSFVVGSLTVDGSPPAAGTFDLGGAPSTLTVRLGSGANAAMGGRLNVGESRSLRFRVRIDGGTPNGTVISNQAALQFGGLTLVGSAYRSETDGDASTSGRQPTVLEPTRAAARVSVTKRARLLTELVANGRTDPGETLEYTIVVRNDGTEAALNLTVEDPLEGNLELLSVTTSMGSVTSGMIAPVRVSLASLAAGGGEATVTVRARVRRPFFAAPSAVSNQAIVRGANFTAVVSDDPAAPGPRDPTTVSVEDSCACLVGAACFASLARNPMASACQACLPRQSQTSFTDDPSASCDTDGDTVTDLVENLEGTSRDTDTDGTPDYRDNDDDGDGIPTAVEVMLDRSVNGDVDGDGVPSYRDTDSDGDSVSDAIEAGADRARPANTDATADGPDFLDRDSDNDCGADDVPRESGGARVMVAANPIAFCMAPLPICNTTVGRCVSDTDADGDGVPNLDETRIGTNPMNPDTDGDGVSDGREVGPGPMFSSLDTDRDTIIDALDPDDDGDTIPTRDELGSAMAPRNTDGDPLVDYLDPDDDDDGVPTATEARLDESAGDDLDMDSVPSFRDNDSDGDGDTDRVEAGATPTEPVNTDRATDGADFLDRDSDNDCALDAAPSEDGDARVTVAGRPDDHCLDPALPVCDTTRGACVARADSGVADASDASDAELPQEDASMDASEDSGASIGTVSGDGACACRASSPARSGAATPWMFAALCASLAARGRARSARPRRDRR
jgi:uncharacterized repeat protein (TIGR01451 family)